MSSKEVILITGSNTGIGFEIVKALCASNKAYDIVLAGRSLTKVYAAISEAVAEFPRTSSKLSAVQIDIEQDESIKKAFDEIQAKFGGLDVLVNNAGGQLDQLQAPKGNLTEREMWNKSWDLNVTGSQVMTTIFMPLLLQTPNPRLIFMTSGTSSIANSENMTFAVNHYSPKGWPKGNFDGKSFNVPAYRSAKTGLNMLMREWHRALHEDGVKVWAISPGFLATGLGGAGAEALKKMGAQDPSVAGGFIRGVIEGSRDADVGKVVTANGTQAW